MRSLTVLATILLSPIAFFQSSLVCPGPNLSYRNDWNYFELDDTIKAHVLQHWNARTECTDSSINMQSSITFLETEKGDTIRLLDHCNWLVLFYGQLVTIVPEHKPQTEDHLPLPPPEYSPWGLEFKVLNTTWGDIQFPETTHTYSRSSSEIQFNDNGRLAETSYEIRDELGTVLKKGRGTSVLLNFPGKKTYTLLYNGKCVKIKK